MFAGVYGGFTGKSGYRDFKFAGFSCYLQSLQSVLRKNNNKCRGYDVTGILQGFPTSVIDNSIYILWGNHMIVIMGKLSLICMKNHTICIG